MNSSLDMVYEFHETFKHRAPDRPEMPPRATRMMRLKLIAEELQETAKAFGFDFQYSIALAQEMEPDLVEAADGFADLDYVVQGGKIECGFTFVAEQMMLEVHRSNMSKLDDNGNPIFREDGKILKGPHYSPPNLEQFLHPEA